MAVLAFGVALAASGCGSGDDNVESQDASSSGDVAAQAANKEWKKEYRKKGKIKQM
jgi:hypothetical protein